MGKGSHLIDMLYSWESLKEKVLKLFSLKENVKIEVASLFIDLRSGPTCRIKLKRNIKSFLLIFF